MIAIFVADSAIVDDEEANLPEFKGTSMFNAEQFYMSGYCSDVRLKIGSVVVPGHKIILSGIHFDKQPVR